MVILNKKYSLIIIITITFIIIIVTITVKEEHVKKLEVVEMRCLRAIRGVTRRERMRNEDIRQELKRN